MSDGARRPGDDTGVSGDLLTTWGVVLPLEPEPEGDAGAALPGSGDRRFARGRAAFFERCPRLAGFLRAEDASLRVVAEQVLPVRARSDAGPATIGVSVVEVRPTAFDMAARVRPEGEDGAPAVHGRCTIVIERRGTGQRIPIPDEIRDEFIAIQLGARELL
jgi:acyl-CoA thioesterase FadM